MELAARADLQRLYENRIIILKFYEWVVKYISNVNF